MHQSLNRKYFYRSVLQLQRPPRFETKAARSLNIFQLAGGENKIAPVFLKKLRSAISGGANADGPFTAAVVCALTTSGASRQSAADAPIKLNARTPIKINFTALSGRCI